MCLYKFRTSAYRVYGGNICFSSFMPLKARVYMWRNSCNSGQCNWRRGPLIKKIMKIWRESMQALIIHQH